MFEQNSGLQPREARRFLERRLADPKLIEFAQDLVDRVRQMQPEIDIKIAAVAENWRIDRMAVIDRNILRLGVLEMLHSDDIPPKVAINEALELAKRYGTAQSSRFVNGILDRLQAGESSPDESAESKPEPEPTLELELESKPELEPEPKPELELELESKPESDSESRSLVVSEAVPPRSEPTLEAEAEAEGKGTAAALEREPPE